MIKKLKLELEKFKKDLKVYQLVYADPRTPKLSKWLLGIAVAYILSPIDLIPDFIPIIGHLDDLIIFPLLVFIATRMIPRAVFDDCRKRVQSSGKTAE
ncbi:MAG: DUF1232 domain-containing protein [Candidatus Omnitrophota bacterium]|nr:DUF1232 domain-containing protein [Candidatus Omnitrophota bacterium]